MTTATHRYHMRLARLAKKLGAGFTMNPVELTWVTPANYSDTFTVSYSITLHTMPTVNLFVAVSPAEVVLFEIVGGDIAVLDEQDPLHQIEAQRL